MHPPAYLIYMVNIVVAISCSYSTGDCLLHVLPVHILHCLVAENDTHQCSLLVPVIPLCSMLDNKISLIIYLELEPQKEKASKESPLQCIVF